jgi:hypothetical protein
MAFGMARAPAEEFFMGWCGWCRGKGEDWRRVAEGGRDDVIAQTLEAAERYSGAVAQR